MTSKGVAQWNRKQYCTQVTVGSVRFSTRLNYSEFAIVEPDDTFTTMEKVENLSHRLYNMPIEEIHRKRTSMHKAKYHFIYGNTFEDDVSNMEQNLGTINFFLNEVFKVMVGKNTWNCDPTPWSEYPATRLTLTCPLL